MSHPLFLGSPETMATATVGGLVLLDGEEGRHAVAALRIRPGERFYLADGAGCRALVEAEDVGRAGVRARVLEVTHERVPDPRLVLVQALAKGDRDEQAVEAATELGVDEVVPWQAERCVVVWRGDRLPKSLARWRAVVARATKQSRRSRMPLTSDPVDLAALVGRVSDAALTLVLHEDSSEPLAGVALPESGDVLVVVGPEGGITERELAALGEAGARPVRLGSAILRSSSAGPAALAVLSARSRWA